jgi:uncharacterized protein (TIGR00730 family)
MEGKYICVFCSSSDKSIEKYGEAAVKLGKALVEKGYGLVFGGAKTGLMGVVADTVLAEGGKVIGVVTPEVKDFGVVHSKLTELYTEKDLTEREAKMLELSEGIICLPGGLGTLEEFSTSMLKNQFASFSKDPVKNPIKPCTLLNINNFYEGTLIQLNRMLKDNLLAKEHLQMLRAHEDPFELIKFINDFKDISIRGEEWWLNKKEEKGPNTVLTATNASAIKNERGIYK